MKESVGHRGDSGKNRMSGGGGISLRIRQGHFCSRVNQQISCPATAGRGKRWSSGSSSSPSTRSGRFLAACLAMTFTPSASRRSAMPPSACCAAPPLRSARSATGSLPRESWRDGRFVLAQETNAYAVLPEGQWRGYRPRRGASARAGRRRRVMCLSLRADLGDRHEPRLHRLDGP